MKLQYFVKEESGEFVACLKKFINDIWWLHIWNVMFGW